MTRKKDSRTLWQKTRDNLWLLLVLLAVLLVGLSLLHGRGADLTRMVARRTEKRIAGRMQILDRYMKQALGQHPQAWLELEGLPEDMVIYRYEADTLQSWCHQFTIDNDDISRPMMIQRFSNLRYSLVSPLADVDTAVSYMSLGPKWYLVKRMDGSKDCKVIGGLEIRNTLEISSVNGVNPKLRLSGRFALDPISESGGSPVFVDGKPLLKIIQENALMMPLMPAPEVIWLAVLMIVAGLLLYLYNHKSIRNMLLSILGLTLLMGLFYLAGRGLRTTMGIFSPTIYADGALKYSLGAVLIINAWIYLVIVCLYLTRKKLLAKLLGNRRRLLAGTAVLLLTLGAILAHIHLSLRSIILNSNISLELYKVSSISRYTVLVYISYMLLMMTIPLILQMCRPAAKLLGGLRYNVFSQGWKTIFSVLCAVYLLAVSSMLGFRREADRVEIWANRLSIDRNLGFELQLKSVENAIANDPLIASLIRLNPDYRIILNRITENYLPRLSNEYDISIYVAGDSEEDRQMIQFLSERILDGTPISDNSRFIYSRSAGGRAQYTGMFVYYLPDHGASRMLLSIESKADKQDKGYAVIMGNTGPGSVVIPQRYSYGKYLSDKLVSYKGDYAYPTVLSGKLLQAGQSGETHVSIDNYMHFVSQVSEEETIVISRRMNGVSQYMVAGFMLALLAFAFISFPGIRRRRGNSLFEKSYFKNRINSVLMLSLVATLIVMAVISIVFVYDRNEYSVMNLMTGKIGTIQSMLEAQCRHFTSYRDFSTQEMNSVLGDISEYTHSDITLYTTSGKVFKSTDPDVFERLILGSRTDEAAYRSIMYDNKRYYIHKEHYAGHSFYSMYAPVFNGDGHMTAILCAPYTDSGVDFRTEAAFHAVFIITIFLILLIITRFLSSKVIDKMFRPLLEMGQKMNAARTEGLEYIIYDREDEISTVVRAYNLMVRDLSESSKQLAQAERDKAWSEMARQVAHEIKNPLTPIKLQIQRIIRMREKNDPQWQEKFDSIIPVIMDSIDTLTDTANEFSTFAKLYSEEPVIIDLDQLASDEIALFDDKDNITFQYIGLSGATISGPKPQFTRVLVNLLTNAVQAIENQQKEDGKDFRQGMVILSVRNSTEDGYYDIVVEDNGPGVKDEDRSRLFTPNFTTKSGGTGLGLAICKNILERCGGDIHYSRSFTLGGACFTVRFPKNPS